MIPLRNLKYILTITAVLMFSGCGLHEYPFLEEPMVQVFGGSTTAVITNRTTYDPDVFRGYELYYKFYDKSQLLSQQQNDFRMISSINNPEPRDLTALGFRRINTAEDADITTPLPMLFFTYSKRNSFFKINIIKETSDADLKADIDFDNDVMHLYRGIKGKDSDGNDVFKSFRNNDIDLLHADIPSDSVTLSLFVFAYGRYDLVYNIYSRPEWLGNIDY